MSRHKTRCAGLIAAALLAAGCHGNGGRSSPDAGPPDGGGEVPGSLVAALGAVVEIQQQALVLSQVGFHYTPAPGGAAGELQQDLAIGTPGNRLIVLVRSGTQIVLQNQVKAFANIAVGDVLLVLGSVTDQNLSADVISDLASDLAILDPTGGNTAATPADTSSPPSLASPTAAPRCVGQSSDYTDPRILDFQGCYGGPSVSGSWSPGGVRAGFRINRFFYNVGLLGWRFDFPFEFRATPAQDLVYHVPTDVSLNVQPRAPSPNPFSVTGGLGVDIGLDIGFCVWRCYDAGTLHFLQFGQTQETTAPAPLEGYVDIATVACPTIVSVDVAAIPLVSIQLCMDFGLTGRPFEAQVTSGGVSPAISERAAFTSAGVTRPVRPEAMSVDMDFAELAWAPPVTFGMHFELSALDMITIWSSPSIPVADITTLQAIPLGTGLLYAPPIDPRSLAGELRYLVQPTSAHVVLAVAPAPTTLRFTSATTLPNGAPVTVQLTETHDGAPIAGQTIAITARCVYDKSSELRFRPTTDSAGIARVVLSPGDYELTASYGGAETYVESSAVQIVHVDACPASLAGGCAPTP